MDALAPRAPQTGIERQAQRCSRSVCGELNHRRQQQSPATRRGEHDAWWNAYVCRALIRPFRQKLGLRVCLRVDYRIIPVPASADSAAATSKRGRSSPACNRHNLGQLLLRRGSVTQIDGETDLHAREGSLTTLTGCEMRKLARHRFAYRIKHLLRCTEHSLSAVFTLLAWYVREKIEHMRWIMAMNPLW